MSTPVESSGSIDNLLDQAMQVLNKARGAGGANNDEEAEPIEGYGVGAEGMIRITAVPGGQLSDLQLDPRVMRMDTVTLSEHLLTAANGALADLQEKLRDQMGGANLDGLAEELKEVQEQSSRQMASYMQALLDAQQRIVEAGRR